MHQFQLNDINYRYRQEYDVFETKCDNLFDDNKIQHEKFSEDIQTLFDKKADRDELKDMLDQINNLLKEVEEAMKWKQPLVQITNRIDKVEVQVKSLLDQLKNRPEPTTEAPVREIVKVQETKDERPYIDPQVIKDLQNALDTKADISALRDLERYLLQRLDDLENSLDRFADKNETKKALKALEKQIKNLFDLLMNQEAPTKAASGEDDAMFAKRPLGGWSCASCAKDIVNLQGMQAEYVPWSKWPLRDPNERIAKSGQGFSRILSNMKPEYVTQPNFYHHESISGDYKSSPQQKLSIKKKKKRMRPMSANRVPI